MVEYPAVRPDDIRRHNLALLLAQVHRDGALTRAELTQRLGVSRSTIGALVSELADLGVVLERIPSGGTRAGRPSHVVGPNPDGPYVVAVDLDVRGISMAAVGIGGTVLSRHHVPTHAGLQPSDVIEAVVAGIPLLRLQSGRGALVGVGVSVPGTVDRRQATIGLAPNLGWRSVPLGSQLAEALRRRVLVRLGNDADLSVLAEHIRGAGRGCDDLVFLMGRTGVGAGLFVNGVPVRGRDGHAGEIGHNPVDPAGPQCHCGKRGCLETYVSDAALLTLAGKRPAPTRDTLAQVFGAARAGRPRPLAAVRAVAASLGRTVAGLINTLNPERVILGGSFTEVYALAKDEVEAAVAAWVLDGPGETVELSLPLLGDDSALLGAAEVAFSALLRDPLLLRERAAR